MIEMAGLLRFRGYQKPISELTHGPSHGRSPSANVIDLRHEGREHSRTWVPRDQPLGMVTEGKRSGSVWGMNFAPLNRIIKS